jgi:anti-sigma factor RsiW
MTAPAQPDPPGRLPELLAAYTDGELDAAARELVERWLAEHPEAREQLRAQRELSPENWRLWQNAEPPPPSEEAWAAVRGSVEGEVCNPPAAAAEPARWKRVWVWVAGGVAAAAVVLAWWAVREPAAPPVPNPEPPRPVPQVAEGPRAAEVVALPVASDDDIELLRVPGGTTGWLVVGTHPLPDVLVLAGPDDVELDDWDPDEWPDGSPKMTTGPGDAPMIFATKGR